MNAKEFLSGSSKEVYFKKKSLCMLSKKDTESNSQEMECQKNSFHNSREFRKNSFEFKKNFL